MAEFKQKIILTDDEKAWIIKNIKPYLKRNDIEQARVMACENKKVKVNSFLLQHLGEDVYFSGSDIVFNDEFNMSLLTKIELPSTIKTIGDRAFRRSSLNEIKLNEGLENIGLAAFSDTDLHAVVFPSTIKSVSYLVFNSCPLLSTIVFKEGCKKVEIHKDMCVPPVDTCDIFFPKNCDIVITDDNKKYDYKTLIDSGYEKKIYPVLDKIKFY